MKSNIKIVIGALLGIGAFATALIVTRLIKSMDDTDDFDSYDDDEDDGDFFELEEDSEL